MTKTDNNTTRRSVIRHAVSQQSLHTHHIVTLHTHRQPVMPPASRHSTFSHIYTIHPSVTHHAASRQSLHSHPSQAVCYPAHHTVTSHAISHRSFSPVIHLMLLPYTPVSHQSCHQSKFTLHTHSYVTILHHTNHPVTLRSLTVTIHTEQSTVMAVIPHSTPTHRIQSLYTSICHQSL